METSLIRLNGIIMDFAGTPGDNVQSRQLTCWTIVPSGLYQVWERASGDTACEKAAAPPSSWAWGMDDQWPESSVLWFLHIRKGSVTPAMSSWGDNQTPNTNSFNASVTDWCWAALPSEDRGTGSRVSLRPFVCRQQARKHTHTHTHTHTQTHTSHTAYRAPCSSFFPSFLHPSLPYIFCIFWSPCRAASLGFITLLRVQTKGFVKNRSQTTLPQAPSVTRT